MWRHVCEACLSASGSFIAAALCQVMKKKGHLLDGNRSPTPPHPSQSIQMFTVSSSRTVYISKTTSGGEDTFWSAGRIVVLSSRSQIRFVNLFPCVTCLLPPGLTPTTVGSILSRLCLAAKRWTGTVSEDRVRMSTPPHDSEQSQTCVCVVVGKGWERGGEGEVSR